MVERDKHEKKMEREAKRTRRAIEASGTGRRPVAVERVGAVAAGSEPPGGREAERPSQGAVSAAREVGQLTGGLWLVIKVEVDGKPVQLGSYSFDARGSVHDHVEWAAQYPDAQLFLMQFVWQTFVVHAEWVPRHQLLSGAKREQMVVWLARQGDEWDR